MAAARNACRMASQKSASRIGRTEQSIESKKEPRAVLQLRSDSAQLVKSPASRGLACRHQQVSAPPARIFGARRVPRLALQLSCEPPRPP